VGVPLPDGQLRFASRLVYTDEPFRPLTADELKKELHSGPYAEFSVLQTEHYLVFYQSSRQFADASAKLLEEVYKGLTEALRKNGVPIHEAEFPLVAVIFRTERDFRAHREVAPAVQAYYEILTNRIFFYETSDRDQLAPELSKLRKPQTVAHEGTHQILANVGVQPRLSAWPLWLIEGLAEYCSPPVTNKKGAIIWKGLAAVNPFHMATIRDLKDPLAMEVQGAVPPLVGRDPNRPLVEYLITREEMTPTDYALAWAMTHYLGQRRVKDFVAFLKTMSQMPPLEKRSPEDHLAAFRAAFGKDLVKLDKAINKHLSTLKYEQVPYYSVVFEQPVGLGRIKRGAMVSQSPSVILQWIDHVTTPDGGQPFWEAIPHPTKARALLITQQWLHSR
jgi:hypothetical protein